MRTGIGQRVFLHSLLISVLVLVFSAIAMRWSFNRGFLEYVAAHEVDATRNAVTELADIYARDGDWSLLRDNPRRWFELLAQRGPGGRGGPPRRGPGPDQPLRSPRPAPESLDAGHVALLDADKTIIIPAPLRNERHRLVPVELNGETVGFLEISVRAVLSNATDQAFSDQQKRAIVISAIAALALAALLSVPLMRRITKPIQRLVKGADAVAAGNLETRISASGDDEFTNLAQSFNRLAKTLEKNRDARQRWVADIAHELRTPLAILRGELDALEDGVRDFSDTTRRSLQAEVARLSQLVDDLHTLSIYDDGTPQYQHIPINLSDTLLRTLTDTEPRLAAAQIHLETAIEPDVFVSADDGRLGQVFTNLIENTLRYTDPPGTLRVVLSANESHASLSFSDSPPGVPDRALKHLFDRLFRADQSRSRESGGSGLGLSICKSIIESHDGTINAMHSPLGGLEVSIALPITGETNE
ncbi:MAG: ATP-binding protein [Pseudomonadota bacterium]